MQVVAERTFELHVHGDPQPRSMVVRVGMPELQPGRADWRAPYEIEGPAPGQIKSQYAYGVDSWQALMGALYIVPTWLKNIAGHAGGMLTYLGAEDLGVVQPPQP
jgi:hypothetical protein